MTDGISTGLRGSGDRLHGTARVFQGFKDFISRGNAIELAVGLVIGLAFGAVINAIQGSFLSPLIGWIFGQPNLENLWDIGPYTWPGTEPPGPAWPAGGSTRRPSGIRTAARAPGAPAGGTSSSAGWRCRGAGPAGSDSGG